MATYTRPAWVSPEGQWSAGQTYEQYAATGQPVASGYNPATTPATGWQPPAGSTYIPSMDVMGQYTNVVSKPSSPDLYGVLTSDSLKPEAPIQVPQQQADSSLADSIAAGTASYADYLKMFTTPKTETSTQYDTLMKEITSLLPEAGGRGAAQLAAEQQYGVTDLDRQLAEIQGEMLTKQAEYKVLEQKTKQRQTTTDVIYGEIVHQKNQMGSEMGLLQARGLGLQGQLDAAQRSADRAVDLKYQDTLDQINIKLKQLGLLEGRMNKEEQERANALTAYLNDQKTKIAEQKEQQKTNLNFALSNNITKPYYKVGDQIYRTLDGHLFGSMEEATKAGVRADLSNVQDMSAPQVVKTETIGSATTGYKLVSYDQYGNVVKSEVLSGATPSGGGVKEGGEIISGLFSKSELAEFHAGGLDAETATDIYQAIQRGISLEEIRQGLRNIGLDPVVLDVFDRVKPIYKILGQEKPKPTTTTTPVNWEALDTQSTSFWDKLWGWIK